MSDISEIEKKYLHELFHMSNGYFLDFSDRTFNDFFNGFNVDICSPKFAGNHNQSKANRIKAFWEKSDNHTAGIILKALADYIEGLYKKAYESEERKSILLVKCRNIANRLLKSSPIIESDSFSTLNDDLDFTAVEREIRSALANNSPQSALDRLHTFVAKFLRAKSQQYGIDVTKEKAMKKPLQNQLAEYKKKLIDLGMIESDMTKRILNTSISNLEHLCGVRNNKSLAHDNALLNYEESILIINHTAATIRFINAVDLEAQNKLNQKEEKNKDF